MEESSGETKRRCPCGFWGSAKTLGLCSVCYRKAHRNQSGNSQTADVGKTPAANKSQTSSQGMIMDSKHFPSRSTTDNLPSSLSSPPGERATLSATSSQTMDASAPTTSGGATSPSHMPTVMSANGVGGTDINQSSTSTMAKPSCEPSPSPVESDTCKSGSGDHSYDPKHDTSLCPSDTCSGLISVAGNMAATISSASSVSIEERNPPDPPASGIPNSSIAGSSSDSASSTQITSKAPKSSSATAETFVINSNVVSSSIDCSSRQAEKQVEACPSHDISPVDSANSNQPVAVESESIVQTAKDDIIPSSARGMKRSRDDMEASSDQKLASFQQKNKKRCYICSCKLELAQRTIGRCRCDRVFCALHRLPELHDCDFNHKEDGRREAREKMVKPTRHLGPSYRREDHS